MATEPPLPTVAIIDSDPAQRRRLAALLQGFYSISAFQDCDTAMSEIAVSKPDAVIANDLVFPHGAYHLTRQLRQESATAGIPVLIMSALPSKDVGREISACGANGYVPRDCPTRLLLKSVSTALNRRIEARWAALPETPRAALKGALTALARIPVALSNDQPFSYSDFKQNCQPLLALINQQDLRLVLDQIKDYDNYTFVHSFKVATMLALFGRSIGLSEPDQLLLASGGLLHDVGKMAIPLEILNKPGRLTASERQIMENHVNTTVGLLGNSGNVPRGVMLIASQHHEKLDGTGYPNQLRAGQIDDLSRMAAIADIYGALTDRRVYKPAMPSEQALRIMTDEMGAQLDQDLLKLFRSTTLDVFR